MVKSEEVIQFLLFKSSQIKNVGSTLFQLVDTQEGVPPG